MASADPEFEVLQNPIGRIVAQILFVRVVPLSGGDAGMPCGPLHPKDPSAAIDGQSYRGVSQDVGVNLLRVQPYLPSITLDQLATTLVEIALSEAGR